MSRHSGNQDSLKPKLSTSTRATDQPSGAIPWRSWLKTKLTKRPKVNSPSKIPKSDITKPSSLGVKEDEVCSQAALQAETPQSLQSPSMVETGAEKLVLRPIIELWDEAYIDLSKKDKSLVDDYEALLSKSLVGLVASPTILSSGPTKIQRCQQMKVLLEKKIKEIDQDKWKLKFQGH